MWKVIYHREVETDLKFLGRAEARRILKAIDERIIPQFDIVDRS
jgi:mRNA-degrading endonuclease RelE of RelBE toxin-antitoxin system